MNLQTATKEQLVTLESIGDKRADLILQKRREKGSLSIDDFAACTNIQGKVWQDWVRKGVITRSAPPGASAVSPQGVLDMARRMEAMERKMEDLIFELGSEKQKNARERLEREQETSYIKSRAEVDLQVPVREMEWKREEEAILQRQDEHQLSSTPVAAATGDQAREDPNGLLSWPIMTNPQDSVGQDTTSSPCNSITNTRSESIIPNLSDSVGSGVLGKCQSFVAPLGQQLPPDPEVREVFFRNPLLLSLVIPVTINGVQTRAVVDSAAQVTVISLKSLSEMGRRTCRV